MQRRSISVRIGFGLLTMFMTTALGMPEIPRGKGDSCIAPTEVMRRQHMDFLLHDRDLTMRQGIRNIQYSLNQCVDCHAAQDANGAFIAINDSGQFCAVCHEYASVRIDCFECHAAKPAAPAATAIGWHRARKNWLAEMLGEHHDE